MKFSDQGLSYADINHKNNRQCNSEAILFEEIKNSTPVKSLGSGTIKELEEGIDKEEDFIVYLVKAHLVSKKYKNKRRLTKPNSLSQRNS